MDRQGLFTQVVRAQNGDWEAYNEIVRQLQDMAVSYALSLLGDFHLAQDAAQDAFVEAYRDLTALRAPEAFVGWFRRIVFKHCDRRTRGKQVRLVPLEIAERLVAPVPDPAEVAQQQAMAAEVWEVIASLPANEREVILLFYMGAYSHREIAAFLEIPVTTVKSRLHASRSHLKERMLAMVKDSLQEARPSKDSEFLARVNENIAKALAEFAAGDPREREIRQFHPNARYRDPHPIFEVTRAIMSWALLRQSQEVTFVPDGEGVSVRFLDAGTPEEVVRLPRSLQEPIAARYKDMCMTLDVDERNRLQEGSFPLHHRVENKDYEVRVICSPTPDGERIRLRFEPKQA
ncbi:MAG TPA: ATPase, T2SS/T4P/T4SS family [Chthonomonadaceae bacterium]|nr:ATPase, T2SS/T4P/T4SS family [Chthonomonadaceae bacterium]